MSKKSNPFTLDWEIVGKPRAAASAAHPVSYASLGNEKRPCAQAGCACAGDYPAPKTRMPERQGLGQNDLWWFCRVHVTEYNQRWDYYAQMSIEEIEADRAADRLWRRKTQKIDLGDTEWMRIFQRVESVEDLLNLEDLQKRLHQRERRDLSTPPGVFEALRCLGLAWPATFLDIKQRYKSLAKKLHPDVRGTDPTSIEALKRINVAYALLKKHFQGEGRQSPSPPAS